MMYGPFLWHIWLDGTPPSMKNDRRVVKVQPRGAAKPVTRMIKSKAAIAWKAAAAQWIAVNRKGMTIAEPVDLIAIFDVAHDDRHDLSLELLMDALEAGGIIANDRLIGSVFAQRVAMNAPPAVYVRLHRRERPLEHMPLTLDGPRPSTAPRLA